jgi:hypothetical protein
MPSVGAAQWSLKQKLFHETKTEELSPTLAKRGLLCTKAKKTA